MEKIVFPHVNRKPILTWFCGFPPCVRRLSLQAYKSALSRGHTCPMTSIRGNKRSPPSTLFKFLQDDYLVCIFRITLSNDMKIFFTLAILLLFSSSLRRFAFQASTRNPTHPWFFARCWHFVFSSPLSHSMFAKEFSHFFPLLPLSQKSLMLWKYHSCKVDCLCFLTSVYASYLDLSLFYLQTHFSACLESMKRQTWLSLAKLAFRMREQSRASMQGSSSTLLPF